MNKYELKLFKLQSKAQDCSSRQKAIKILHKADKARRAAFKARQANNIKRGRMSAAYWAAKVKLRSY